MLLYLHGFASAPSSLKAQVFRTRFAELGEELLVPALDEGDFEHLTLTRQLAVAERAVGAAEPLAVIGSSMGGYLAALLAARRRVDALVLMAPAFDFARRWQERLGADEIERWRREGRIEVDHAASKRRFPLAYDLMEDAARHEPWPVVGSPALVFQGRADDVVLPEGVERWVRRTPSARWVLFDSGHDLVDCVDRIVGESLRFLASIGPLAAAHPGLARAWQPPGCEGPSRPHP